MALENESGPILKDELDLLEAEDRKLSCKALIIISVRDDGSSHQGCDNGKEADVIVQIIAEVVQVIKYMWQERRRCQKCL